VGFGAISTPRNRFRQSALTTSAVVSDDLIIISVSALPSLSPSTALPLPLLHAHITTFHLHLTFVAAFAYATVFKVVVFLFLLFRQVLDVAIGRRIGGKLAHLFPNPVVRAGDSGKDTRFIRSSAPDAPTHHARLHELRPARLGVGPLLK